MSTFERYLTLWVALCIVVGIALGHWFPGAFQAVGALEIANKIHDTAIQDDALKQISQIK